MGLETGAIDFMEGTGSRLQRAVYMYSALAPRPHRLASAGEPCIAVMEWMTHEAPFDVWPWHCFVSSLASSGKRWTQTPQLVRFGILKI